MAETIAIPSPSHFLPAPSSSPSSTPASKSPRPPPPAPQAPPAPPAPPAAPKASDPAGLTKRKQSKSRNGCLTCKTKRLKCDETKPTCQQCARRGVECGGYKKDFKWRPLEETNFTGKQPAKPKKPTSPISNTAPAGNHFTSEPFCRPSVPQPPHLYYSSQPLQQPPPPCFDLGFSQFTGHSYPPPTTHLFGPPQSSSSYLLGPPHIFPNGCFMTDATAATNAVFESENMDEKPIKTSNAQPDHLPQLTNLFLPGTDLDTLPQEYKSFRSQHEEVYQSTGLTPPPPPPPPPDFGNEDGVEEIPRDFDHHQPCWVVRTLSPTPSDSSSASSNSRNFPLFDQPQFAATSPEALLRRYDRDTCGVLSVKDGPNENPWRTLVWPLARDCPALYHAIASMTSFHHSKDMPAMRVQGIDHMRNSLHALAASLEMMPVDAAISTTLVLAFSESWDQHISTGINHIKGAKILIDRALVQHNRCPVQGERLDRLKFLCNTWIYMDVLARLTSTDENEANDFDFVYNSMNVSGQGDRNVDPLMGCATTLFPIIGRIANLVRKVRRTDINGPVIISQALELKTQLEEWEPPSFIEDPEDETTSVHDSTRTATAYQLATLLYLHQAVPELPSLPSAELAEKVLRELALVKPRSRTTIVHIYPLMAAGSEVVNQESRDWVRRRWELMSNRMKLGIIDRCLEVTKEVWKRRDDYAARWEYARDESISPTRTSSLKRKFGAVMDDFEPEGEFCWLRAGPKRRVLSRDSMFDLPTSSFGVSSEVKQKFEVSEYLDSEYTVKGSLHWVGVMKDWNWEVLLG